MLEYNQLLEHVVTSKPKFKIEGKRENYIEVQDPRLNSWNRKRELDLLLCSYPQKSTSERSLVGDKILLEGQASDDKFRFEDPSWNGK